MENRFINRYRTFCRSLKNLEKSRHADPSADFVLEGTVLNFNLTFDISWKVRKSHGFPRGSLIFRPFLQYVLQVPDISL